MLRWSGQTEVGQAADIAITPSISTQLIDEQTNNKLLNNDEFFITPFEVIESELKTDKTVAIEPIDHVTILAQAPNCPKCNSEMIKRVAKKGPQQGQTFFGCSQFPKCRGVVNVD
ncbi:topoisomerase DNA-binding C4 zinc finger domain-containing protein [Psychrobacter maritimus]|uniref:topoisomerase DNA-binding C4 zinc finger domain-containing protein n=1 Tax=Psychrobacter maritimus TaxID=256325 RepID=UPI002234DC1C|nr:topoisomerase DNA-binding C4 zinc finger domain-containing protein [Psychrobacter maritimus]